jgi:putative transposase
MDAGGISRIMARRHTPEQVIAKVRQGQKMLNDGRPMVEVIKELQITEATWYRWLNQYGSEKNAEASRRTRELEKENARLKRLLAEKELAIDILNEVGWAPEIQVAAGELAAHDRSRLALTKPLFVLHGHATTIARPRKQPHGTGGRPQSGRNQPQRHFANPMYFASQGFDQYLRAMFG